MSGAFKRTHEDFKTLLKRLTSFPNSSDYSLSPVEKAVIIEAGAKYTKHYDNLLSRSSSGGKKTSPEKQETARKSGSLGGRPVIIETKAAEANREAQRKFQAKKRAKTDHPKTAK